MVNCVPDYYISNLTQAIGKIKNNMAAVGREGESFIFISDIHWEANTQNSPYLIREILNKTNIKDILCTGDLINQGEKGEMATTLIECVKSFSFDGHPFITTRGNHDDNSNWIGEEVITAHEFNFNEFYSYFMKQMEGYVTYFGVHDASFYYDKLETKTRYIFIDSRRNGYNYDRVSLANAVIDLLNTTENGWHIIFIQHWPERQSMDYIKKIVDGCNSRNPETIVDSEYHVIADFSNAKCKCVSIFAGHVHKDMNFTTDGGIPIIVIDTDCGAMTLQTDYPFVRGTVTEQCFDVVTMDYTNRTIKCVRVGRGIDREFNY
jgi:UDP-2,3-diacylglucosamine pyrophosphatase LpxH